MSDENVGEDEADDGVVETESLVPSGDSPPTSSMSWLRAFAIGFGVFLYFAIFTVIVPSKVISSDAIASADEFVQNVAVTTTWAVALIAGLVALRQAQRRGWI